MTDSKWLRDHLGSRVYSMLSSDTIHDFLERVAIRVDGGMKEGEARDLTFMEFRSRGVFFVKS